MYGEDGMDISKVQFLKEKQLPFLSDNSEAIVDTQVIEELKSVERYSDMKKHIKQVRIYLCSFHLIVFINNSI